MLTSKWNTRYYDWFACVAFASPGFLDFVSSVFRPFLADCIFSSRLPEPDYLRRMIALNWICHVIECPLAAIRVLVKSEDKCWTPSNTFFDLALRRETAALFGLVKFNQSPGAKLIALLRRFLIYPSENCLYQLLIPTLIGEEDWDSKNDPNAVAIADERRLSSIFFATIPSDFDFKVEIRLESGLRFIPRRVTKCVSISKRSTLTPSRCSNPARCPGTYSAPPSSGGGPDPLDRRYSRGHDNPAVFHSIIVECRAASESFPANRRVREEHEFGGGRCDPAAETGGAIERMKEIKFLSALT
jgi:hypothetical protein